MDGKLFGQYYVNMNTWPPSGSTSFNYMGTPLPFGNLTFTPSSLTIYDGGAFKKLIVGWEYLHDPDQNYYHAFNGIYWVCTSPLGEDEWRLTIENEHYRVPNSYTPVDDESDTDLKPDIHHNNNPYPTAETWNREGYTLVTSGDTYTYYKGTVRGY